MAGKLRPDLQKKLQEQLRQLSGQAKAKPKAKKKIVRSATGLSIARPKRRRLSKVEREARRRGALKELKKREAKKAAEKGGFQIKKIDPREIERKKKKTTKI
ncbi:MAG: hypothetical protein V3W09_04370 [Nitrososphaerales archaeon]